MELLLNLRAKSFILLSTMMLLHSPCHSDTNVVTGYDCSQPDNSATDATFQTNLNNLLSLLAANDSRRNGFYAATAGKGSNKIDGLMQCRGDISAADCAACISNSTAVARQSCPKSKKVKVWFTWCFLHYSDEKFFGVWDQTGMAKANDTNFDDPSVVSKGFNFMNELASTAYKQPLMFQTAVLDVGQSGKRYGMAQCTRDLSSTDCGRCLNAQLVTFKTIIGNKRAWETYGSSCFVWYNDYQFYFNFSISANGGDRRSPSELWQALGITIAVLELL